MAGKGEKSKTVFPPLLSPGFHHMSADDLKALVVDEFPLSVCRSALWDNLVELLNLLVAADLACDIWIDGSFLTRKIDPEDVDLVVNIGASISDNPTQEQREIIEKIADAAFYCDKNLDSYVMVNAPVGHKDNSLSRDLHRQWENDFGYAYVSREPKGIAVVGVAP